MGLEERFGMTQEIDIAALLKSTSSVRECVDSVRGFIAANAQTQTLLFFGLMQEYAESLRSGMAKEAFLSYCITQDVYAQEFSRKKALGEKMSSKIWLGLMNQLMTQSKPDTLRDKDKVTLRRILVRLWNKKCFPKPSIQAWGELVGGMRVVVGDSGKETLEEVIADVHPGDVTANGGQGGQGEPIVKRSKSFSTSSSNASNSSSSSSGRKRSLTDGGTSSTNGGSGGERTRRELDIYRGGLALQRFGKELRLPPTVAYSAFEIFNILCYDDVPERDEVVVAAAASLVMSAKIHGDRYPRPLLRNVLGAVRSAMKDDVVQQVVFDENEIQTKVFAWEHRIPSLLCYDFESVAHPPMCDGGLLQKMCSTIGLSREVADKAVKVLKDDAYVMSHLCWTVPPMVVCGAAVRLVHRNDDVDQLDTRLEMFGCNLDEVRETARKLRKYSNVKLPKLRDMLQAELDKRKGISAVKSPGDRKAEAEDSGDDDLLASIEGSRRDGGHASPEAGEVTSAMLKSSTEVPSWARGTVAERNLTEGHEVKRRRFTGS